MMADADMKPEGCMNSLCQHLLFSPVLLKSPRSSLCTVSHAECLTHSVAMQHTDMHVGERSVNLSVCPDRDTGRVQTMLCLENGL